jgi:hypothetical protein
MRCGTQMAKPPTKHGGYIAANSLFQIYIFFSQNIVNLHIAIIKKKLYYVVLTVADFEF